MTPPDEPAVPSSVEERVIVVGLPTDDAAPVIREALGFAAAHSARLVLVRVDDLSYVEQHWAGGAVPVVVPTSILDPEAYAERARSERLRYEEEIAHEVGDSSIAWKLAWVSGNPATELISVADREHATLLIVGAHRSGGWGRLTEWVGGSVAAYLVHHQRRPVVVLPRPRH